jgi:tRNA synthetases class II (D, K and N)
MSPAKRHPFEMQASARSAIGWVDDPDIYPIQPKPHTLEYLREVAHLRPRTNVIGAATRVRHSLAQAIHRFFDKNGFFWVNTPIITASDAEGATRRAGPHRQDHPSEPGLRCSVPVGREGRPGKACVYDPRSGQLLSGSFLDYAMPRADLLPAFDTEISEVPSTTNPLGMRGGSEGGITWGLAAVANSIVDALAEFGVEHIELPATPERVWNAIRTARP